MANRFWVGGTANWDGVAGAKWATVSGGAGGAAVPTVADDVFLDGASGVVTVTIAAGNTGCLSLICTGFTGTLAGAAEITIAASMTLAAGMTFSYDTGGGGLGIHFTATAAGKTITTAGKSLNNNGLYFDGAGGGWTLQDNLTQAGSGQITLTNSGTLDLNGKTVTTGLLSTTSAAATLTCGAATINTAFVLLTAGSTFNANTSTFNLSGGGGNILVAAHTFNIVNVTLGSGTQGFIGANTFANLTLTGAAFKNCRLTLSGNLTVTGTYTITGNTVSNRLMVSSDTPGTARTITAAVVAITDADFQDITGAGAASPFTGTRIGNCEGNAGITFTAGVNKFWVNDATVAWDAVNSWATTTGGAGATNNYPLPQDTAVFDAPSFSANGRNITIQNGRFGSVSFTGLDQTMTWTTSGSIECYGDITLGANVTIAGTGTITMAGRNAQTITSAGKSWTGAFTVDSLGGTVTLADAMTIGSSRTTTLTNGSIDLNGKTLSTGRFSSSNANIRALTFGVNGKIATTDTAAATVFDCSNSANLTVNRAAGAAIEIGGNTANTRTFAGGGKTWPALTFTNTTAAGQLNITGSNTFKSLAVSNPPQSVMMTAGTTTTIEDDHGFPAGTAAGSRVTIGSITAANHALAKAGGGKVSRDFLSVSRSDASPGTTWYAGNNSVDGGNNSGWIFTAPPKLDAMMMMFKP